MKNGSAFLLFLFACFTHALSFIYFVGMTVSTALDGSRIASPLDWFPFLLFLATFTLHALPGLRDIWKAAPGRSLLLLLIVTSLLVWLLISQGVQVM